MRWFMTSTRASVRALLKLKSGGSGVPPFCRIKHGAPYQQSDDHVHRQFLFECVRCLAVPVSGRMVSLKSR